MRPLTLILLIILGSFSCSDEAEPLAVTFEFKLLGQDGVQSTSFSQGENFVFSFSITNNSKNTIMFQSMETDDFFKVYKLDSNEGSPIIEIGKPYVNIFCTYQNGYPIEAGESLKIEIPWTPIPWEIGSPYFSTIFCGTNDNPPLTTGSYRTGFKTQFYFTRDGSQYITPEKSFEIDFNVQ